MNQSKKKPIKTTTSRPTQTKSNYTKKTTSIKSSNKPANTRPVNKSSSIKSKTIKSQPLPVKKSIKKKKRLRPWIFIILIIVFCTIFVVSIYKLWAWHKDNQHIKQLSDELQENIPVEQTSDDEGDLVNPPDDKESDYWYYTKLPFYDVDFNDLLQKNPDTVAFIHMDDTNINYPVVQTTDNDYYLKHAYDKSRNSAGWVFMDYRNQLSQLDDNTIIYGHGRLDKTVFGSLKNALTSSWQAKKDNYAIWLSTPNTNMIFQIFSIYKIESESYYITSSFPTTEAKQNWLNTMKSRNVAPIDTPVSTNDSILTLSTCSNNSGGRIVVHAKLVKQQQK